MIEALCIVTAIAATGLLALSYVLHVGVRAYFDERRAERAERASVSKAADVAALEAQVHGFAARLVPLETDMQKRRQDALVGKGRS